MKRRFVLMCVGLGVLYSATSCSEKKEEKEEQVKYLVTSAWQKDTTITKEYVSQIHAYQHIEVRALEKGYLQKIYVDEGQHVQQGQLMFQIMPMVYKAELQKSKAEASYVNLEYQNTKQLADKNVVSKNELALAQAKLDKANAEVGLAKTHLDFTTIRAPFSGMMDHFQARLGSLVDEGDLLTTLSDNSKMWVYFNVPEAEYLSYKAHARNEDETKVNLKMANNEVFQYPGVVQTIEADFNNETGNIAFRATFPNPKGLLRNGETGSVLMTVPLKNALIIPQKATFEVLEKKFVYVVDKNNVVHQKEVTVASEMPQLYIISGGLAASDKIMLEGIRKVKDGDKISFTYQDPKVVASHLKVYSE
ncbi:efflux RND transporter periplasmic adaptor subunit [Hymenobacter taeanensis]|uniref:Efflux RND transporter periplasmic adaptor subunit n=1 Tax=Hymenobacter taeanensis TaxID=2735321 RepID=A0A6M6BIM5_9BACT|nr:MULTISPECIES: efflux RND transporter periplasmic adaptor subunit [Hymenobacter]QJX47738.1 efflux RND transporter periplasmic adaptor subunit [Hymenobacter taeanensis]UOQ82776.1 efflux RND transporter periplasmic adaptor subunit [Hymenobacter sp. 5414T-23]